jgi:membrane-associated phospholipid phosphatase
MMLAYVALTPIETPTHAQALLGLAMLVACLPVLILFAGALARARGRTPSDFIEGVCGRCGYSLQGLPGTICPECGADTSIVGTRRSLRRLGGAWIACTLWIVLLLMLNSLFKFEIEGYILRLAWQVEEFSRWMPSNHPTKTLRLATVVTLMAVGVAVIIWFSRRRVTRMPRES